MDVATRLIDSITGRFFFLTTFPCAGRARDEDFGAGSRSFAVGEYVICVEGATFSFSGGYTADATSKRCSISDPGTSLGSRTSNMLGAGEIGRASCREKVERSA